MKAKTDLGITLRELCWGGCRSIFLLELAAHSRARQKRRLQSNYCDWFQGKGAEALSKVAPQFPKTHFTQLLTVKSMGLMSDHFYFKSKKGLIWLAHSRPSNQKPTKLVSSAAWISPSFAGFALGYTAGAHAIDPNTHVATQYIGMTAEAWNNPAKGKEIALSQYHRKALTLYLSRRAPQARVFLMRLMKRKISPSASILIRTG